MMPKNATAVVTVAVFVAMSSIPHGLTAGDDTTLVALGSNDDIDTGTCFYSFSSLVHNSSSSSSLSSPAPAPLPLRPPPPRSSSSLFSSSSLLFTLVWATFAFGFAVTLVGMILRKARTTVAKVCDYAFVFLIALAFFSMMGPFVPDHFAWTVWAAAGILFLSFVYSIAKRS